MPAALFARLAFLLAALVSTLAGSLLAAETGDVTILHHESLAQLSMRTSAELSTRAQAPVGTFAKPALETADLVFTAFGRTFDLVLEPNDAVIDGLSAEVRDRIGDLELYRGSIIGVSGSWARISRAGNEISGLIFDGAAYYAIDPVARVADELLSPPSTAQGLVVYRLHDTIGVIAD